MMRGLFRAGRPLVTGSGSARNYDQQQKRDFTERCPFARLIKLAHAATLEFSQHNQETV